MMNVLNLANLYKNYLNSMSILDDELQNGG
jgi:hypothetical protein